MLKPGVFARRNGQINGQIQKFPQWILGYAIWLHRLGSRLSHRYDLASLCRRRICLSTSSKKGNAAFKPLNIMQLFPRVLVLAACGWLSACSGLSDVTNMLALQGLPVADASVRAGATRQQIEALEEPIKKTSLPSGGVCYDYVLRKGGRTSPYYIAFNRADRVKSIGFKTCDTARRDRQLESDEPLKQLF